MKYSKHIEITVNIWHMSMDLPPRFNNIFLCFRVRKKGRKERKKGVWQREVEHLKIQKERKGNEQHLSI